MPELRQPKSPAALVGLWLVKTGPGACFFCCQLLFDPGASTRATGISS